MADYFLLLDAELFETRMRPALAESWRRRSFEPCRDFCTSLLPRVEDFTRRYHVSEAEPLAAQVARGLVFHRDFWRALAGELLFHAADEVPEFQTCPETLFCLLATAAGRSELTALPPAPTPVELEHADATHEPTRASPVGVRQ